MSQSRNTNQAGAVPVGGTRRIAAVAQHPMSSTGSSGGTTPTPSSYIPKTRQQVGNNPISRAKTVPNRSVPPALFADDTTPTQARYSIQLPSPPNTIKQSPPKSSHVPEAPTTPNHNTSKARGRYPDSLARVPLHRRGTSSKYETMEDLLREAGYKETRVFTPEMERLEAEAEERRERERNQSGVMNFFTGLISRTTSRAEPETPVAGRSNSPREMPPSPTAFVKQRRRPGPDSSTPPPLSRAMSMFNSSADSLPSAHPRHSRSENPAPPHHRSENKAGLPPPSYHPATQRPLARPSSMSGKSRTYAEASPARAYLRHMSSAPSIKRSSDTSARPRASTRAMHGSASRRGNGEGETDSHPPLPRNWIATVTQAVLYGTVTPVEPRYIDSSTSSPSRAGTLYTNPGVVGSTTTIPSPYSVRSRGRQRHKRAAPKFISASKCRATQGAITETHVLVRSAPASRAGSRVRADRELSGYVKKDKVESIRRKRRTKDTELPVLARTTAENDGWEDAPLHLPDNTHTDDADDEDDEGEIDLARMLVPPKREHSILSLRKHLPGDRRRSGMTRGPHNEDGETSTSSLLGHSKRRNVIPEWA